MKVGYMRRERAKPPGGIVLGAFSQAHVELDDCCLCDGRSSMVPGQFESIDRVYRVIVCSR